MRTSLVFEDVKEKIRDIATHIFQRVPAGVGSVGAIKRLSREDLRDVVRKGAAWAVEQGYGTAQDLEFTEEYGCLKRADPDAISERAYERGAMQVGTLGSGNHFLEIDVVDKIYKPEIADAFGLFKDQVCLFLHSGSRGFGYQVCDDHLKIMDQAMKKYAIQLPDRQLACAPLDSVEGKTYLSAMSGAANFAWANRQVMMHLAGQALMAALNVSPNTLGYRLVYDVCHNIGKFEEHEIDGRKRMVCMHRKGATRAFPPGHPQIPAVYRDVGQPVLIPGDMGTGSYILVGTHAAMKETFGTSCHGAGRVKGRRQALREAKGRNIHQEMAARGVTVMSRGKQTLAEEMPEAYKDVNLVVDVIDKAGISLKVAKLKPIGVVKG